MNALGARVIVIGNGSEEALRAFALHYADGVEMYTDPDREAYKALELTFGMGGVASIRMIANGLRAVQSGHRQGRTEGHPLQQGGVCVVDTSGSIRFLHRDVTAGDHVDAGQIRDVLREITATSPGQSRRMDG